MKAARIGAKAADIERASEAIIKEGLLKLGLITDASGPHSGRGTRTASVIGSAWTSTTSATTSGRSKPGWRS